MKKYLSLTLFCLVYLFAAQPASAQSENREVVADSLPAVTGYPVFGFFNDTLFFIYNNAGTFSAKERAKAISSRVKTILHSGDSLTVVEDETIVNLVSGINIIMSITAKDAASNHTTQLELAQKYKSKISSELALYQSETSYPKLLKEAGLAVVVIIITIVFINYLLKLFRWIRSKVQSEEDKRIKGIKIKNYTLFDAKRQVNALLAAITILKWFFVLLVIYIALPILFGIFPWTKNFASVLFGYILTPLKSILSEIWNYLPNLFTIIVIVVVFRYVLKLIHLLKSEIEKGNLSLPGFYPEWANPTYQIIRVIIMAFMLVVIFPYLPGSDSPIFKGVSVFLGFLFTFGSAGALSNLISGLVLTYMRLFKIGDVVKIGEVMGAVIEKSLLVTRIKTIKNEIISIPNSLVMSNHTMNYSSETPGQGLIIHTTVTIGYAVPWKNMHQALIDAALKTELILKDPMPFVLQTSLNDFYVTYQINAYIREARKQAVIYSELHQNIQDVCNERGIEIMSPHYLSARDGNMTTIPADYLPGDYKAPPFEVRVNDGKDSKQ